MPLIAKEVVYRYPGEAEPVLRGFALDLTPGHVVALCGAARSGRSTVLALLAGLLSPQEGTVMVDGTRADSHEARGRVGLLLQNADEALFGLTVREDVMFAPLQFEQSPEDADALATQALRAVHLEPEVFAQRSPFSLSGGQRRRAAIAGVMAMNPTYLLLDEPFAGLDPQGRGEIVEVIRGIATQSFGQHTGILVALTEIELALHLADTLLILHEGCVAWQGPVTEFVAAPPAVEHWGLRQPELLLVAERLREQGWHLPVKDPNAHALAEAIAAYLQAARR